LTALRVRSPVQPACCQPPRTQASHTRLEEGLSLSANADSALKYDEGAVRPGGDGGNLAEEAVAGVAGDDVEARG